MCMLLKTLGLKLGWARIVELRGFPAGIYLFQANYGNARTMC